MPKTRSKLPLASKRNNYLLKTYGINEIQYNELLSKQDSRCAICFKPPKEDKNLCVDHDHVSGEIRGLLCGYCNRYLVGRHRDPTILRRIADYISQGTGFIVPKRKKRKRRKRR